MEATTTQATKRPTWATMTTRTGKDIHAGFYGSHETNCGCRAVTVLDTADRLKDLMPQVTCERCGRK